MMTRACVRRPNWPGLGLQPEAEHVLTDVGLPADIEFFFTPRPPVRFSPAQHPEKSYCQFGTDEGGDVSITLPPGWSGPQTVPT